MSWITLGGATTSHGNDNQNMSVMNDNGDGKEDDAGRVSMRRHNNQQREREMAADGNSCGRLKARAAVAAGKRQRRKRGGGG